MSYTPQLEHGNRKAAWGAIFVIVPVYDGQKPVMATAAIKL